LILLTIAICTLAPSARAVDFNVALSIPDDDVPAVMARIERHFMDKADTNVNGSLTSAEALSWLTGKIQDFTNKSLVEKAKIEQETIDASILPQDHQDALDAYVAAKAALDAIRSGQ